MIRAAFLRSRASAAPAAANTGERASRRATAITHARDHDARRPTRRCTAGLTRRVCARCERGCSPDGRVSGARRAAEPAPPSVVARVPARLCVLPVRIRTKSVLSSSTGERAPRADGRPRPRMVRACRCASARAWLRRPRGCWSPSLWSPLGRDASGAGDRMVTPGAEAGAGSGCATGAGAGAGVGAGAGADSGAGAGAGAGAGEAAGGGGEGACDGDGDGAGAGVGAGAGADDGGTEGVGFVRGGRSVSGST